MNKTLRFWDEMNHLPLPDVEPRIVQQVDWSPNGNIVCISNNNNNNNNNNNLSVVLEIYADLVFMC